MVHVDDKHRDDDGESDEDHNEEEILPDERDDLGGRWDDLYDKEEHSERHKDGGGERELLPFIRRKIEHQHGQERQTETRNNKKVYRTAGDGSE